MTMLKQNKELWDLFTRREEYNPPILDQYGRFPYYLSKHRNVFEPEGEQRDVFRCGDASERIVGTIGVS
jgi:hypothetical protein